MKREYVSMSNSWIPLRFALEDPSPMSDIPSNVEEAIVHYREFVKKERVWTRIAGRWIPQNNT